MKKVLVILAVLAMTGVASAALLSNPESFEAPAFSDGLLNGQGGWEGWQSGSGSAVGGWSGDNNFSTVQNSATDGEVLVSSAPHQNWWNVSIAINHGNPAAPGPVNLAFDVIEGSAKGIVKIEYYDDLARTTQVGIDIWDPTPLIDGTEAYFQGTAPAGTNFATIVIGLFIDGGNPGDSITIDNVSIPEPATMALLGLGGLLLRRKK